MYLHRAVHPVVIEIIKVLFFFLPGLKTFIFDKFRRSKFIIKK